nr:transmembrane protein 33 homolog [Ipomoea batatas]
MGGGEDPQKLKKIAAAAYDYENDPKWADYWSNILIPPHMSSRSDVVDHYKRKFYQRHIDPDLVVEPMAPSSSSQQAKPSAPQTSSSSTSNGQSRAHTSESSGRTSRTSTDSTPPASNPTSLRWDRQTVQFSVNAWKPRAWNMQALQVWLQSVIVAKDFIYFIYCLTFVTSHLYLKFALIPILCQELEHIVKFLRRNFSRTSLYRQGLRELFTFG